jgi:hypothetical protein
MVRSRAGDLGSSPPQPESASPWLEARILEGGRARAVSTPPARGDGQHSTVPASARPARPAVPDRGSPRASGSMAGEQARGPGGGARRWWSGAIASRTCSCCLGWNGSHRTGTVASERIMYFGGRVNRSKKKLDENFGRN